MDRRADPPPTAPRSNDAVLVWIDAEEAVLVRWRDEAAMIEAVRSEVPPKRRSTGHVRHDPRIRHGGGGTPQSAGEPRRLERLRQFVAAVTDRIAADEDVIILGSGTVRTRLETSLREADRVAPDARSVTSEASPRLTHPQLVARLREAIGAEAPRRVVGAAGG